MQPVPCTVQSGKGGYALGIGARMESAANVPLSYDTILVAVGVRAHAYSGFCARTVLVGPTPTQKSAYEVLLAARDAAVEALRVRCVSVSAC
jgi:nucleosome binding factor SPN SPT16 subunit